MSKKLSFILLAVLFVALIAAAVVGYDSLTTGDDAVTIPSGLEPPSASITEAPASATSADTEAAPSTAPNFTVYDMEGSEVKLSDYVGKPTVVNFWATWCNPCFIEMPYFEKYYGEYSDRVNFLMVNLTDGYQDTVEGVKAFIEENGFTFPVYCDTDLSAASTYNVYSIPLTIFINSDGTLAGSHLGTMSEKALESYLNQLIEINS